MEVGKRLPNEDQGIYPEALTYLHVDYTRKVCEKFSEEEKSQAFFTAFDGITPRRVILLGMALHTEICEQPDLYEETLAGEEKKQRHEHMLEHLQMQQNATLWALRKYSKMANQPSEPTAPSGRGSP